jgi:hypothetical protein
MNNEPTEAFNPIEISEKSPEIVPYWQKYKLRSWADICFEIEEEEERVKEEEERAKQEEERTRYMARMEERRRLYAIGLYELEEGEILE